MSRTYGYGHQMEACKHVRSWCQTARQMNEQLLADPRFSQIWGQKLLGFATALASLERGADWHLQASRLGAFNPAALTALLDRAQRVMAEWVGFLGQNGLVEKESMMTVAPEKVVPIGQHTLPPLPYAYDALEPHIDAKTMQLHHDKHHLSYVNGLNKAEQMMAEARQSGDFDLIKHWEREAAFNGAGHYLHTIFWNIMTPGGGGAPSGALAAQIEADFGSFDRFKQHFSAAAEKVEGGGWATLVWQPRAGRLQILQAEKHQNLSQWDVVPLLVLDVWEHAYYLKYQNERKPYIAAWWNVVNWPHVAERFEQARTLQWEPF